MIRSIMLLKGPQLHPKDLFKMQKNPRSCWHFSTEVHVSFLIYFFQDSSLDLKPAVGKYLKIFSDDFNKCAYWSDHACIWIQNSQMLLSFLCLVHNFGMRFTWACGGEGGGGWRGHGLDLQKIKENRQFPTYWRQISNLGFFKKNKNEASCCIFGCRHGMLLRENGLTAHIFPDLPQKIEKLLVFTCGDSRQVK